MSIVTLHGDCREMLQTLGEKSIQTVVTSPPYYGLRKYSDDVREIGQEAQPDCLAWTRREPPCSACYVCAMRDVFAQLWRVLRDDGTCWLNLGDSYAAQGGHTAQGASSIVPKDQEIVRTFTAQKVPAGFKQKDLLGIPWRVALALQADGWYLRSDIIWSKPNCMPESVQDRPTRAHEYVFLLAKSARYFYDAAAIAEPANTAKDRPDKIARHKEGDLGRVERIDRGLPGAQHRWASVGLFDGDGTTRNRRTVWTAPDLDELTKGFGYYLYHLADRLRSAGVDEATIGDAMRQAEADNRALYAGTPDVWSIATQPYSGAHYATMPEALIEPCILAGSSAQACEHCGAPWVRVVERESIAQRPRGTEPSQSRAPGQPQQAGVYVNITDKGFAPSCACPDNTGSAASVVLDPFGGSGTVARVALRLQRRAVLIELNQAYIDDHIESRTDKVQIEMFV